MTSKSGEFSSLDFRSKGAEKKYAPLQLKMLKAENVDVDALVAEVSKYREVSQRFCLGLLLPLTGKFIK